jgi:hypothetical protein
MGNVPGPEEVWKVQEGGETWGQCNFFIENDEYSLSVSRTIATMNAERQGSLVPGQNRQRLVWR